MQMLSKKFLKTGLNHLDSNRYGLKGAALFSSALLCGRDGQILGVARRKREELL